MTVSSAEICLCANRKEKQNTSPHSLHQVRPSQALARGVIPDLMLLQTSAADSRPSKDNSVLEALRYSKRR